MTRSLDSTIRDREPSSTQPGRVALVPLVIAGAPVEPKAHLLTARTTLGRAGSPEALGLAADPRVSRQHATLTRSGGDLLIANQSSSGTEVNGASVDRATLRDGDLILLGESALLVRTLHAHEATAPALPGLLGESVPMRAVRRAVARMALQPLTVLLLGESGTGKEVVARALHAASDRDGPFVALNCAAVPATLAESTLFGHVAGAFTGAQKASAGVFRGADRGTLFLDELAELPLELQAKLLRVLEDRQVVPVGSLAPVPVDVRVVAATNRNVVDEVRSGRFRGDLYARVAEFTLQLPPLRDRLEDLFPLLAHHHGGRLPPMQFELLRALLLHPWPFNVRELRTIAAQLRILAEEAPGERIPLAAIGERLAASRLTRHASAGAVATEEPSKGGASASGPRRPRPTAPTRTELEALLRQHGGSVSEVARATSRSRKQVYRWIAAHGVDPDQYRGEGG
ncbi:MAG: sigma 54-interacting transcriptional regulator [Sandaracinus sp.]